MSDDRPPPPSRKSAPREDREVDYLICRNCSTPCYVFEVVDGRIMEATCLVCGNDSVNDFTLGEDAGSEDD
jgi:hypothetical protein